MTVFRTAFTLCIWLLAVWLVLILFAHPRLSRDPVNWAAVLVSVGCLLAGAWFHGRQCRWIPLFFIYGCLGGLLLIPVFYPRGGNICWKTQPRPECVRMEDWVFTIACIVGVVVAGVVCRLIAATSFDRDVSRQMEAGRCLKCGYLLYGLPEPRCPECGTPFAHVPTWKPGPNEGQGGDMPQKAVARMETARCLELVPDCQAKLASGEETEGVLTWLRERGCTKIQSIMIMSKTLDIPLNEAKELVHCSEAWHDVRDRDDAFHEMLERALEELSSDESVSES